MSDKQTSYWDQKIKTTGPSINRGEESVQSVGTPWDFIRKCERQFGAFSYDLAADKENAKADKWFDESQDSLKQDWKGLGTCWLNPPFSNIGPWAKKCCESTDPLGMKGPRIVMLTPASVGANWFADHVYGQALVIALNGRLTFEGHKAAYPKDCMLSVYGLGTVGFRVWSWKGARPPCRPMHTHNEPTQSAGVEGIIHEPESS